ncbi:MAG: histidinol-phosphatase HisJ family protein [Lachnospiraceae bacterium]
MILADFHTHCLFSTDSKASPEEMAAEAARKGLSFLCFTDHMDLDYPGSTKEAPLFVFSPEDSFKRLGPLRTSAPLQVRIGIELGLRPNRPDINAQLKQILSDYPFDFVLGSVHLSEDKDPYEEEYWRGITKETALARYFDTMLAAITGFSDFDSLGHLDYIIRYIPAFAGTKDYRYADYREVIDEILRFLVKNEKALEINTKGLAAGLDSFHPMPEVLSRYRELGGTLLTIGSDAHCPAAIASEYEKTRELLLSRGFTSYCVFTDRKPELMPL